MAGCLDGEAADPDAWCRGLRARWNGRAPSPWATRVDEVGTLLARRWRTGPRGRAPSCRGSRNLRRWPEWSASQRPPRGFVVESYRWVELGEMVSVNVEQVGPSQQGAFACDSEWEGLKFV